MGTTLQGKNFVYYKLKNVIFEETRNACGFEHFFSAGIPRNKSPSVLGSG